MFMKSNNQLYKIIKFILETFRKTPPLKLLLLSYDKKSKMNIKNITFLHVYQTLITKLYKMFVMTFIGRFKLRVKDKNILSTFV